MSTAYFEKMFDYGSAFFAEALNINEFVRKHVAGVFTYGRCVYQVIYFKDILVPWSTLLLEFVL